MNDKISHMGHAYVSGIQPLSNEMVKIDIWVKENKAEIANNDDV